MTPNLYLIIGGVTAAAIGGVRHWLTRGRSASPAVNEKATGTGVPEGGAKGEIHAVSKQPNGTTE
jgi:hypothetical protein